MAWATTGVPVLTVEGQNTSAKPAGRAFLISPLSRCKRLPRPRISIPSTRTRLLRKLITIGAAKANNLEVVLAPMPDAVLTASVTAGPVFPKRPSSRRLPAEIKGESASEAARAIWVRVVSPVVLGARSNRLRNAPGSSDLEIMPPSTEAMEYFRPCQTDCSGAPNAPAIPPTLRESSMPNKDANKESAIYLPSYIPSCAQLHHHLCPIGPPLPGRADDDMTHPGVFSGVNSDIPICLTERVGLEASARDGASFYIATCAVHRVVPFRAGS